MPDTKTHRYAACTFIKAYFQINDDELVPARAMMLFYSALHLVEVVASVSDLHYDKHGYRMRYVESLKNSKVTNAYQRLSRLGSKGRYNPHTLSNINSGILDYEYFNLAYKPILYWAANELDDQTLVGEILAYKPTQAAT